MHAECAAKCSPCLDAMNNSQESSAEDRPHVVKGARQEPALPEPASMTSASTLPRQNAINPNAERAQKLMDELEALLKSGETQPTTATYPQSLTKAADRPSYH